MNRQRLVLVAAALLVLLGIGLIALQTGMFSKPPPSRIGGPFALVDQSGKAVTEKALRGKWNAVFFGYTYCPDVCPGTLQNLIAATDQLGPRGKDLRIVFISVDPKRDKPDVIKRWLEANGAPASALGLSGTPEQVAAAAKAYGVTYLKEGEGDGYQVNHTTYVYLVDPKGRFVKVLQYNLPDEIVRQTADAMRGS